MIKVYLKRLMPAANATAISAALIHMFGLALAAGFALEMVYIGVLTYILALLASLIFGAVLLLIVGFFRLGPILSLVLFFITAQIVIALLSMMFFETEFGDLIGVYHLISIPPTLIAWYFSVYHVWKGKP